MTKRQIIILIVLVAANLLIGYGVFQLLTQRASTSPTPTTTGIAPSDISPSPSPQRATPSLIPSSTPRPDITYEVQDGDTLWDIAEKFGISLEVLLAANPELNAAALLYPGDEITIPSPDVIFTAEATPRPWE